jgi:hypothetical protein
MAAPRGNRFWEARAKHGRDLIFTSSDILWGACCEYFVWADDNPLYETKAFAFQGIVTQESIPKMRAMTIDGLCLFLDISTDTWKLYTDREDFIGVTRKAENVIRSQKFSGAAADLLNANIIARDLGLTDKKEVNGDILNPLTEIIKEISGNTLGPSISK